jgi:hypothetical protein
VRHVRFTPEADIVERDHHVRFAPKADIRPLFDHLVGEQLHLARNGQSERGTQCFYRSIPARE